MPTFRFKRVALDDLQGIVRYIAADNPAAARKFRDDLYAKLQVLSVYPNIAPERPDIATGLRYLPFGNYLIFYLPERDGIVVIRVLHGARLITPEALSRGVDEN